MLQVASAIGRVFSYPLLAQVVEPGTDIEPILGQLADLEFVYVTALAPQREYSFKHVLTQEAVYQTLLRPRREEYHERIGKALVLSTLTASKNTTRHWHTTMDGVGTKTRR